MKQQVKLTIPKPCHENWDTMTPDEQGRFCSVCAKKVTDFTAMSTEAIAEYFIQHRGEKTCGRFRTDQLNTPGVTISIPVAILERKHSFYKSFLLALLVVMGTTLLSCETDSKPKEILGKVIIDSTKTTHQTIDSIADTLEAPQKCNTVTAVDSTHTAPIPPPPAKTGEVVEIITIGEVEELPDIEEPPLSYVNVFELDIVPEFPETPPELTKNEKIKYFTAQVQKMVITNLKLDTLQLNESKNYNNTIRIYCQFRIDTLGNSSNHIVKAPNAYLEEYTLEIIKKLPRFSPGIKDGNRVTTQLAVPIKIKTD